MGQAQSEAAASEETAHNSQQPAAADPSMGSLLAGQSPSTLFILRRFCTADSSEL